MERLRFPITQKEAKRSGNKCPSEGNKNALFPSQLRELRKEKGVSQDTLAKELGVSKSTVGLWENGDTLPDAKSLYELSVYFGISADWLLGRPGGVKSLNADVAAVGKYTGLSEAAIEFLHSIHNQEKQVDTISAIISHGAFSSIVDYVLELKDAKVESEFERWGIPGQETERIAGGGRIVRGFEHEIFLEYMIETCLKAIVEEITRAMIDKEYPIN